MYVDLRTMQARPDEFFGLDVLEALGEFAALVAYPEVAELQKWINRFADKRGVDKIGQDGRYGGTTHDAFKAVIAYWKTHGYPELPGPSKLDEGGPAVVGVFLASGPAPYKPMLESDVAGAQVGWIEHKQGGAPGPDADGKPPPVVDEQYIPPATEKAGLGTVGWFLIGLGAVAAAAVGWKVVASRRARRLAA